MKNFKPGTGFAIFVIFFAVALLESIKNQEYIKAAFWLLIGIIFFMFDLVAKQNLK